MCSWELASLPAVLIEKGPSGEADRPREYQMIGVWSGFSMRGLGWGGYSGTKITTTSVTNLGNAFASGHHF